MPAREYRCRLIEKTWVTPTVMRIRFEPGKGFSYEPGQFLSLIVPREGQSPVRRAYSFASPGREQGYELCVKHVEGGLGSGYLARLSVGDCFRASAPYGHFLYETPPTRSACFISTGTGLAPLRSMVTSERFLENRPERAIMLFGARTEDEIIYPGFFESLGIEEIDAISAPGKEFGGFKGRVTDYLRSLPRDWGWHSTDFYICGNGAMVTEVCKILRDGNGVPEANIHKEVYFTPSDRTAPRPQPAQQPQLALPQSQPLQQRPSIALVPPPPPPLPLQAAQLAMPPLPVPPPPPALARAKPRVAPPPFPGQSAMTTRKAV
jgi:ferredoxin-NADP reductase